MSHMLCPGALQFAQSSVVLYKWDCICNRYISYDFNFLIYTFSGIMYSFFSRCPQQTASSIDEAPFFLVPNRTCIPQLLSWIMRSGRRLISQGKLGSTERLQVQLWRACLLLLIESINGCAKGHPIVGIMTPIVVKQLHTS